MSVHWLRPNTTSFLVECNYMIVDEETERGVEGVFGCKPLYPSVSNED